MQNIHCMSIQGVPPWFMVTTAVLGAFTLVLEPHGLYSRISDSVIYPATRDGELGHAPCTVATTCAFSVWRHFDTARRPPAASPAHPPRARTHIARAMLAPDRTLTPWTPCRTRGSPRWRHRKPCQARRAQRSQRAQVPSQHHQEPPQAQAGAALGSATPGYQ